MTVLCRPDPDPDTRCPPITSCDQLKCSSPAAVSLNGAANVYIYLCAAAFAPQILVILWPASMQLPGRDLFAFKQFVIAIYPTCKERNPPVRCELCAWLGDRETAGGLDQDPGPECRL